MKTAESFKLPEGMLEYALPDTTMEFDKFSSGGLCRIHTPLGNHSPWFKTGAINSEQRMMFANQVVEQVEGLSRCEPCDGDRECIMINLF